MALIGVCVFLPLSLLKDLHQLKSASSFGLFCMFLAMAFLNIDCIYWSNTPIPDRHCEPHGDTTIQTDCTASEVLMSSLFYLTGAIVQTVACTVSSLMCHYNIPKFWSELKNKDTREFTNIIYVAGLCGIITYCGFAFAG